MRKGSDGDGRRSSHESEFRVLTMTLSKRMLAVVAWAAAAAVGACSEGTTASGTSKRTDASVALPQHDAGITLPGCAEYCERKVAACGGSEPGCLLVCSQVDRAEKLRCVDEYAALQRCYAKAAEKMCDAGTPPECLDELGRTSSCFETNGADSSGCVRAFGDATCQGDFVDGRSAQKTCYPGVVVPAGCISVGEILALRGTPGEGPPATNPDGTLAKSTVVCCPP
jgi:hypothetical protein